ncbi:protein kinase [Streptomyces sp. NPDC015350]|uniref:serine/threonine-protein kinase n=1 Tax=Streptomyces sp. NPDC015350 TaxID=3364955 RepID=UPI003702FFDD
MTLEDGDPRSIGGYTLEGRLGAGGMGVVYRARSLSGRQVAVKVIRPELAQDQGFRDRFRREVEAARQVSGAFTAPVVDADAEGPTPWLATLFVPGLSLAERVARQGTLSVPEVRRLAAGLAEALRDIHRTGLVHRDLKPGNVLLAEDGPRVIDFGISWATDATRLTRTGATIGTPPFMAPEQFRHDTVGPAADVFSLGAVLVHAATGHGPFDGDNLHTIGFRVVYEEPDLTSLPDELRPLITACLAKDPAHRPTLQQLLESLSAPGRTALPRPPASTPPASTPAASAPDASTPAASAPDASTPAASAPDASTPVAPAPAPPAPVAPTPTAPATPAAPTPTAPAPPVPGGEHPWPVTAPAGPPPAARPGAARRRTPLIAAAALAVVAAVAVPTALDLFGDDQKGKGRGTGLGPTPSRITTTPSSSAGAPCVPGQSLLRGAGSATQRKALTGWIRDHTRTCPDDEVAYEGSGSGLGFMEFQTGKADFAVLNEPMTSSQSSWAERRCGDGRTLQIPVTTMPVAVVLHLEGVDSLVLDARTVAGIFTGRITRWNDPAIARLNRSVPLPAKDIGVLHHLGLSQSTLVLSHYLAGAAPEDWPYRPKEAMPVKTGEGVPAENVAARISGTDGTISYLPMGETKAEDLIPVRLDTGGAQPVLPDDGSLVEGAAKARRLHAEGTDLAMEIDHATRAQGAYPIFRFGYAVLCAPGKTPAKTPDARPFFVHAVDDDGRRTAAQLGYGALPKKLAQEVENVLERGN